MARIKYYYDTETCKYERVRTSWKGVLINMLGFVVLSLLFSVAVVSVYWNLIESPKEKALRQENEMLKDNFAMVNDEIDHIHQLYNQVKQKDNEVYRIIFEANPLPENTDSIRTAIQEHKFGLLSRNNNWDALDVLHKKAVTLRRKLQDSDKSYQQLLSLAKSKGALLTSIPAIQPVSNKHLKMLASGFGMRIHPIYKVKKMHTGIDFAAKRGTPVYATGDGVVVLAGVFEGYGNCIDIQHGFGYMTRYGHLEKCKVQTGHKVKRGELIGYVGTTGMSTSPHLHYEVHKNGRPVDPVHYFFNDLSPKEYEEVLRLASIENQSLGGATAGK